MVDAHDSDNSPRLRRAEVLSKLDICSLTEHKTHDTHTVREEKDVQHTSHNLRSERFSSPNVMVSSGECRTQVPDIATVVIPPPVLYLNQPTLSLETEIDDSHSRSESVFTDEEETFFDELMSSTSSLSDIFHRGSSAGGSTSSSLDRSHANVVEGLLKDLPSQFSMPQDTINNRGIEYHEDEGDDDNITPQASPHTSPSTIRRWSVKKRNGSPRHEHLDEDLLPTPTASPYVGRPLSPSSRTSSPGHNLSSTIIDPPTPYRHLSPETGVLQACLSASSDLPSPEAKLPIVRRHSVGNDTKRMVHYREGSYSTECSPQSTPIMKRRTKQLNSPSAGTEAQIESAYQSSTGVLISSASPTHIEPNLRDVPTINIESPPENGIVASNQDQSSTILPPPVEFMDKGKQMTQSGIEECEIPSVNHQLHSASCLAQSLDASSEMEDVQLKDLSTLSHDAAKDSSAQAKDQTTVTVVTPYESNPEEMMSFDEVLASLNDYASTTGKTTKSTKPRVKLRSQSPEAKRRREKKKKRSQTVANIDADTMQQVKEEIARNQSKQSPPRQQSDSKVYQLVREHSRKIKDHQRSRIFRRFSTVVEEPEWLQQLREQKKDSSLRVAATSSDTVPEVHHSEKHHTRFTSDEEATLSASLQLKTRLKVDDDPQRKGGFKGWVRSLVDKFSTSGNVKDK